MSDDTKSAIDKLLWVQKQSQEQGWPFVVLTTDEAGALCTEIRQLLEAAQ